MCVCVCVYLISPHIHAAMVNILGNKNVDPIFDEAFSFKTVTINFGKACIQLFTLQLWLWESSSVYIHIHI